MRKSVSVGVGTVGRPDSLISGSDDMLFGDLGSRLGAIGLKILLDCGWLY